MLNEKNITQQYNEAVKNAAIKNKNIKKDNKGNLLILNLLFFSAISFFGYNYLYNESLPKTKVMGITYVPKPTITSESDIDYAAEIEKIENMDSEDDIQLVEYVNNEIKKAYENRDKRKKKRDISK